jgi:hypothetical protein
MKKRRMALTATLVLALLAASAVLAAAGDFSIPFWSVDSGGGTSRGGEFVLNGSIGQPDAGRMSGGDYVLQGGVWGSLPATPDPGRVTYLPLVLRLP